MPTPIEIDEKTYVFRNPEGNPITTQWWPRKSWYPMLCRIKVRVRKFYATGHTFITDLISRGEDMKAVAEYCGTSVAMIERSYGRWMPRRSTAAFARSDRSSKRTQTGTFPEPSSVARSATA